MNRGWNRDANIIRTLVRAGCSIYQVDRGGNTAIHLASKYSNVGAVEALMELGPEAKNMQNYGGFLPGKEDK
jgi:ankyrin repeat protein